MPTQYKPKKAGTINYPLNGIPEPLWREAQAFAAAATPPLSMKWVLQSLLERWVESQRKKATAPPPPAPPERRGTHKRQPKAKATPPPAPRAIEAPDLGDAY